MSETPVEVEKDERDPRINVAMSEAKLAKIKGKPCVKKEPKTPADEIRLVNASAKRRFRQTRNKLNAYYQMRSQA